MDENAATEVLTARECWDRLREVQVGRLAVTLADGPDIFPVNYLTDHGTVVFRTGAGTKPAAIEADARVALEADGVVDGVAWSVVIRGRAELIKRPDEILESFSLPLTPWQGGKKDQFVRIVPDVVSGRRFAVVEPNFWGASGSGGPRAAVE